MKPKPARSMHCATASGLRSMRTPSASSTSAEPDSPVAERLPCLATAQPAPAAISAAVVGGGLEAGGQVGIHDQGVIAGDRQRVGQAPEQAAAVMGDLGRLAVHG